MVSIQNKFAGLAGKYPDSQRHLLNLTAMRASHTCVAWVDLLKLPTSIRSFVGEYQEEGRPRNVRNRLCKVMVLDQSLDVQVFDGDVIETINQILRRLVVKIFATTRDFQVSERDFLARLRTVLTAALLAAQSPLKFRQILAGVVQVARILNRLAVAQSGKRLDTNVNADALAGLGQWFRLSNLANEQREPSISAARDAQLDATAFNRATQANPASPDTRNGQLVAPQRAGALRFILLAEGVVAVAPFEARKACLSTALRASLEERLECLINALKCIALNRAQVSFHVGQATRIGQMPGLLNIIDRVAGHSITLNPLLKGSIVNLARVFKFALASLNEIRIGANLKLESFVSYVIFGLSHRVQRLNRCALW